MGFSIDFAAPLRSAVAANMEAAFSADRFPKEQYTEPKGDPGLFGPDSVTWKVHAHSSAIIGGISSLMLQSLHPLAMAGVAEHSDYKTDPFGRLSRTASFVAGTTFAATPVAEQMIFTVNRVHRRISGVAPDGRPYAATDPDLIRWVHVAEMTSIINAHRRYHPRPARGADLDRYFDENAIVAEKLGGTDIPRSRAEVRAYFRDVRSELVGGGQSKEALAFLMEPIGREPIARGVSLVLSQAAVDLMPTWAQRMHGIHRPLGFDRLSVRPATFALLATLSALTGAPIALTESMARAAATPAA